MRTHFYKGTAFELTAAPVPRCFVDLDKHFDRAIRTERMGREYRGAQLAEILCSRVADVAYFGEAIPKALRRRNPYNAGLLARTLLVAHFGASKAVLDAGAIALSELYDLGQSRKDGRLTEGQVDFRKKGPFRTTLRQEQKAVYDRYVPFFSMIDEIVEWRNAVVHRMPPLLMIQSQGHPSETPRDQQQFLLILRPEAQVPVGILRRGEYGPPLYFHERWYDGLVNFCAEICRDIGSRY